MTALEEIYEFEIGAKVLAYYRGLLYEATCINRRFSDEGVIQYYVHYKGFKKKWDEWTDYDEVLAINKTNLAHKNNLESLRKACRSKRVKKSQKPKKTHYASSAKPEKRKRGRPKKNVTQSAGPASKKCLEQAIAKCIEPVKGKSSELATATYIEPVKGKSSELATATYIEPAAAKFVETGSTNFAIPASAEIRQLSVKVIDILKYGNKTQFVESAIAQFAEPIIEKSADSAISTFEEPTTTQFIGLPTAQFAELAVDDSAIHVEPDSVQITEPAPAQFSGPDVEKFAESAILTFEEPTTTQFAGLVPTQFAELVVKETKIQIFTEPDSTQFAVPATSQFSEGAIEKSAESALLTFEEPATIQFAALVPTQFPELTVKKSDLEIIAEPHTTQTAGPATDGCVEAAVEKSTESPIQIFAGPSTSRCAESSVENSAESVMHTVSEPAVTSKRVKKSQDPWTTEDDSSSTPANKKRCTPKKNVEQAAGPSTSQLAEPAIEKSVESAIQTFVEPAVGVSAIPVVEQSIQTEEGEEAVRAVENVVIDIIPRSKHIAIELFKEIKLPLNLQNALDYDRIMHFRYQKVLKFGVEKSLAEIIYAFANSPYFIDDDQKKNSTMFCLTLMKYFNYCVHKRLTYLPEKKFGLRKKAVHYFTKRINAKPTFNFKFKSQLIPKSIWCYLYGPMYLVRLIADLPKMLLSNLWFPDYDLETFVHQIKCLIRFLEDNLNTYFSNNDYIDTET